MKYIWSPIARSSFQAHFQNAIVDERNLIQVKLLLLHYYRLTQIIIFCTMEYFILLMIYCKCKNHLNVL